eukprot:1783191-Heterocapsa_arctica.AAC.1
MVLPWRFGLRHPPGGRKSGKVRHGVAFAVWPETSDKRTKMHVLRLYLASQAQNLCKMISALRGVQRR